MGPELLIFLIFATFVGALVSSLFGLAGGTILFFLLALALDAKLAIPLHAGVQLIANGSRLCFFFKDIQWRVVAWFSLLLVPGALLGGWLYMHFNPEMVEWLVGLFILLSVFMPRVTSSRVGKGSVVSAGFISGFLGMIVAVTGPFIAALLNLNQVTKERLVATKSCCQALAQAVKLIIFSTAIQFDFSQHQQLIWVLGVTAVIATWTGKSILRYVTEVRYQQFNKALFLMIAALMLLRPVYQWLQGG
ncbi:MAG: sulfite exporter TauE/SafE family protein [Bacteroidota bacterium]